MKKEQGKKEVTQSVNLDGVSENIWNAIKDRKINMFSIPNQNVSDYCNPVPVEPSKLYLLAKASALLPVLEELLGSEYSVEQVNKYIVVSKV